MNESELSDDILKTADADHVVDVGGKAIPVTESPL